MRKWTYELIIVAVVICVGLGIWWFVSTNDERQARVGYEQLVKIAQRQKIEIVVIRQAAELLQLKTAIQRQAPPPPQAPIIMESPVIADPKDVP